MAVRAIFGESIAASAGPGLGAFAARFGEPLAVTGAGGLVRVFPSAAGVRKANGDLDSPIRTLAEAAIPGDEESLIRAASLSPTAAAAVALRAFRQPDAFPPEPELGEAGEIGPLSERWRPWRGYAAIHLWRTRAEGA
jgi:hypothetical protein